jgi:hypothetical protein
MPCPWPAPIAVGQPAPVDKSFRITGETLLFLLARP